MGLLVVVLVIVILIVEAPPHAKTICSSNRQTYNRIDAFLVVIMVLNWQELSFVFAGADLCKSK